MSDTRIRSVGQGQDLAKRLRCVLESRGERCTPATLKELTVQSKYHICRCRFHAFVILNISEASYTGGQKLSVSFTQRKG